ncbi:unnamed protein product [Lampetra planeri]
MAPFLGCLASLTPVPSVCAGDRNYDRCYLNALPPPPPSSGTLRNTPRPRAAITSAAKAMEGTAPNSGPVPHWQGNCQPVAVFAAVTAETTTTDFSATTPSTKAMRGTVLLFLLLGLLAASEARKKRSKGDGFGEHIDWVPTLEMGLEKAKASGKPLMLVLHKDWCPRCQDLKPQISGSTKIYRMSGDFVMIQTEEDPKGDQFALDGHYAPRILFLHPNGQVMKEVYNKSAHQYKYYYSLSKQIEESMDKAKELAYREL